MVITYKKVFSELVSILKQCIENPELEALELICFVLGIKKETFYQNSNENINQDTYKKLIALANKRKSGYPLQFILGEWDFYGRTFLVGEGVLIPRADTEVLVQKAIDILRTKQNPSVLDLCSGSGCLGITIKKEVPNSTVTVVEKSDDALKYLKKNVLLNNVDIEIVKDDVLTPLYSYQKYDVILSNPPYLTKDDMESLQKEVTFEPEMALYGGDDGLKFYRELTNIYTPMLKKDGYLLYEIGIGQEKSVSNIMKANGFKIICFERDLYGIIRIIYAKL